MNITQGAFSLNEAVDNETIKVNANQIFVNKRCYFEEGFFKAVIDSNDWTETVDTGTITEDTTEQTIVLASSITNTKYAQLSADNIYGRVDAIANKTLILEWRMKLANSLNQGIRMGLGVASDFGGNDCVRLYHENGYTANSFILHSKKDTTNEFSDNFDLDDVTNYHTYRIELSTTDVKLYQDGTLKMTNSTQVPNDVALYPIFKVLNENVATNCTATISWVRYYVKND